MRKLLNKPWFVAALVLAAVAFVWNALRDQQHSARASASVASAVASDDEEPGNAAAPTTLREALAALVIPAHLSDPFAPRVAANDGEAARPVEADELETVHLSAIWQQGGETLVLINNRICRAGDAIGRLTIESASLEGVWLKHWKGRDFVRLGGDFTLATPAHHSTEQKLALNER